MKIVYGLFTILVLLKAGERLYKFFNLLFTNPQAIDPLTVIGALLSIALITYFGYSYYKDFYKLPNEEIESK